MNDKVNERMCVVCRNMYNKNKLLRIAKIKDSVIIDENYGNGDKTPSVCAIEIPKSEICTEIGDEITVHILVSDSLIR